jgi:hypothetical protein
MQPTCIRVFDESTLALASDYFRDGVYSDKDLQFDNAQGIVTLSIWKADDDLATYERTGWFSWWRLSPMRRLKLSFGEVQSIRFDNQSPGSGKHPLGGSEWNHREKLRIYTYDGINLEVTVNRLDGQLEVTDEIDRDHVQKSRIWTFRKPSNSSDQVANGQSDTLGTAYKESHYGQH